MGMIINGFRKYPFNPPLNSFDRIAVEDAQKQFVFGHAAGLFKCLLMIVDKFQGGNKASIVERIIIKGKIFGKPAMKIHAVSQVIFSDIQHIWRRIDPRGLKPPI